MRSCRLKITHIFACGCFRKYRNLEKLRIFNYITYGVRFSPISVYLYFKELKYVLKNGYFLIKKKDFLDQILVVSSLISA